MVKAGARRERSATFFMSLTTPTGSSGRPIEVSRHRPITAVEMIAFLIGITDTGDRGQGQEVRADTITTQDHLQGQNIPGVDTPDLGQGQMIDAINIKNPNIKDQGTLGQGHDQIPEVLLGLGQGQKGGNMIIGQETTQNLGQGHSLDLIDIQSQGQKAGKGTNRQNKENLVLQIQIMIKVGRKME